MNTFKLLGIGQETEIFAVDGVPLLQPVTRSVLCVINPTFYIGLDDENNNAETLYRDIEAELTNVATSNATPPDVVIGTCTHPSHRPK